MELKQLYKYTLDNKWYPMLKKIEKDEIDLHKVMNKCIFCADSVNYTYQFKEGNFDFVHECSTCRIDKTICNFLSITENSSLCADLYIEIETERDKKCIISKVKEIIKELEKHTK